MLCFCCLSATAETQQPNMQKNNKGFFSKLFNNPKKHDIPFKTKLEMKYYQELLKQRPKDVDLLENYGKFLKDHEFYDESIKIYNRLINLTKNKKYQETINEIKSFKKYNKRNATFLDYINKAKLHESQGDIIRANEDYLNAQKIFPDRIEVKFGLAKTYGWLGKPKEAIKNYQAILKNSPDNIDFLEAYAKFLKDTKDYANSITIYKKLVKLTKNKNYQDRLDEFALLQKGYNPKPTTPESAQSKAEDKLYLDYIKQAEYYESKGEIKKAHEYYQKADKKSPKRFEAMYGLAKTSGWMGLNKAADTYYKELLKITPNNKDLIASYNKFLKESKGYRGYKKQPKEKSSKKVVPQAPQVSPIYEAQKKNLELFSSYIKQAQTYESEGKAAEANEYYLKAQKIDPYRYEVKFGLAKTYGWLHNDKLAQKYYSELLKQTPDNNDLLEAYANFLRDTKNYSQAMEIYKNLLTKTNNEKYNANIAEILFLQKDYQSALNMYMDFYNKNPNNVDALRSIGLIYFVMGDFNCAIKAYQQYFTQNKDPKSIVPETFVNYAKSLFYTKNIESAKAILENYVQVYPNDAEALSTLADIYLATKNNRCARELVSRAIQLKPDEIRYRIQCARVDIADKNYEQARRLLCELLKLEPRNPDILENLGDVAYNTGDFKQALCYYQSIPNFQTIKKINFKIAQAYHYNKDYCLAEDLYEPFVCDLEYSNKAKIGIAEIKISENKPEKARPLLRDVLDNDPWNVQARKNLAISYYSTGDNYTSINILKKLPKDDDDINDINYNLAKAYNSIERRDIALDLLDNNPLDRAQALKGEIRMQIRPAIEPLYHNYYMYAFGNANAGKYQKAGGTVYYYPRPNMRLFASGVGAEYKNVTNLVSTTALINTVGLEGQLTDHLGYRTSFGVESFSNGEAIFLGSGLLKAAPNDVVTITSGYIRSLDEIDSYMSAAGVVPSVGPFANQLVGRIIDNKYIVGQIGLKLPHKFYAYGGFNIGNKYGSNSPSNTYREIPAGLGKVVYSNFEDRPINQALLGYDFYYTGYNYDRSGFGGANLNYSPIGSDGQAISPSSGFPGTGGYFSPTFFIANKFPLTIKGSFMETKLKYILSGFVGTQTIEGQIGILGTPSPGVSQITTNLYYGYSVGVTYNEKGRVSLGLYYTYNNYMLVEQHLFKAAMLIRL